MATNQSIPEGSESWQAVAGLTPNDEDIIVSKITSDAFDGTSLVDKLNENKIGAIVLCGVATEGCIKDSFTGAKTRGYKIFILADGHSTFNPGAEEKIMRYNTNWSSQGAILIDSNQLFF